LALFAQTEAALLQVISRMTYLFLSTYPVCREQITLGGWGENWVNLGWFITCPTLQINQLIISLTWRIIQNNIF